MKFIRFFNDSDEPCEFYIQDKTALYVNDIKDLNIIVGANNTRKSRFVRKLISIEKKVLIDADFDVNNHFQERMDLFNEINDIEEATKIISIIFDSQSNPSEGYVSVKVFFDKQVSAENQLHLFDIKKMVESSYSDFNSLLTIEEIRDWTNAINQKVSVINLLSTIYGSFEKSFNYSYDTPNLSGVGGITYKLPNVHQFDGIPNYKSILSTLRRVQQWFKLSSGIQITPQHSTNLVYIPTLRGSRKLEGAKPDVFLNTIKHQYKLGDNPKLTIETGLDLYEKIMTARNGRSQARAGFTAFEKFLSEAFFQSREIDIIAVKSNDSNDQHVEISIFDENSDIPIHHLGDGIQAIIVLLLPVFTARNGSWIFIDEPENNLHPGFQNLFLHTISRNSDIIEKSLRFFINTHSNHILSEAFLSKSDTEIFVFSRRDKDSSNISIFNGNEHNTLEMLGVFNTSVLISNCSIWVEGITDRLYLRSFLRAYSAAFPRADEPVEGFDYSFVEYAGNNLVHYSFDHELHIEQDNLEQQINAFFINSNVFLIADSDFSKDEKHKFYDNIASKRHNFEYFKTEVPEIENVLPEVIIKNWLIEEIKCDKTEVDSVFETPIGPQKLGAYLDEKLSYKKNKRKFTKTGEGGTLRSDYKTSLADFVHKAIAQEKICWTDLKSSPILENMVKRVFAFISNKSEKRF